MLPNLVFSQNRSKKADSFLLFKYQPKPIPRPIYKKIYKTNRNILKIIAFLFGRRKYKLYLYNVIIKTDKIYQSWEQKK